MITGIHFLANLSDCDTAVSGFCDKNWCKTKISLLIRRHGLKEAGSCYITFGAKQGVSGIVALYESHLSLHTWPELGYITLDVFVCNYYHDNAEKAKQLLDDLIKLFKPSSVSIKKLVR